MQPVHGGFTRERRTIVEHLAAVNFEIEQFQPVLDAREMQEVAIPRCVAAPAPQQAPQAPQADWIKAEYHHMSLRRQYAAHFTQHLMRVIGKFESVRQEHDLNAAAIERQLLRQAVHACQRRAVDIRQVEHGAHLCVTRLEQIDRPGAAKLHRDLAEQARPNRAQRVRLDREQRTSGRLHKPLTQLGTAGLNGLDCRH